MPGIWAAGDVTAVAQFTPIAQYQARVAVADMFGEDAPAADYSVLPTSIFTDPELGGVGLTEEQAREQGHDVGVVRNERVKRFQFVGAEHGLFKIVFDRDSRKVLGLHVVSRSASEIVQGFSLGLRLGATVDDLAHDAPRLPDLRRGRQGRRRARRAVDGRPGRLGVHGLRRTRRRPGQASGLLLRSRRAVLANGAAGNRAPGGGANWTVSQGRSAAVPT